MPNNKFINEIFSDRKATRNVIFNFFGKFGSSIIMLLFIPIFIKILGVESWGIAAFSISLASIAMVFDFGFGATLNRELAKKSGDKKDRAERIDLLYSLDIPFVILCLIISGVILSLADYIASDWLKYSSITYEDVLICIQLSAFIASLQILIGFYTGGLQGLQRQFVTNIGRLLYSLALFGGGSIILYYFSATVVEFFLWQFLVVSGYCLTLRFILYHPLRNKNQRPRLCFAYIRRNYKYSFGIAGTTILVVSLTQIDKLLLSNLLSLEEFSIYMLAVSVTGLQVLIVQPVQVAVFPQFSAMYSAGDEKAIGDKFFFWSKRVSLLIFPIGVLIIVFSQELAYLWLQDIDLAKKISLPMSILAAGSMLNAVNTLPYTVQLSSGWTSLGFHSNLIALAFMLPLLFLLANEYGQSGAATVWLILNLGYVFITIPVMFRRLISDLRLRWYRDAFILPFIISLIIMMILKSIIVAIGANLLITVFMLVCGVIISAYTCWKYHLLMQRA